MVDWKFVLNASRSQEQEPFSLPATYSICTLLKCILYPFPDFWRGNLFVVAHPNNRASVSEAPTLAEYY